MPRAAPLAPADRRAAILAATEPLLVARGHAVSTREIAAAAGVAEGTIFRVFPTKDALIDAVIEEALDLDGVCADLGQIEDTLDLETRLTQAAELLHARLTRVIALFHTLVAQQARPLAFHAAKEQRERQRQLIHAAVARVIAPDAARLRVSPGEAATLLNAMLMAAAHPMLPDDRVPKPRQIVAILLHGVVAPGCEGEAPGC